MKKLDTIWEKIELLEMASWGRLEPPRDAPLPRLRHALLTADRARALPLLERVELARVPDQEGAEPIHDAAMGGDPVLVARILELGADPCQASANDRTPFDEAIIRGHVEVVEVLLDAAIERQAVDGLALLRRAAVAGQEEIVRLLVQRGIAADPPVGGGRSVLQEAAAQGRTDLAIWLMDSAGADANFQDEPVRSTALLEAARGGHADTVAALLSRGADLSLADHYGDTALHQGAAYAHEDIVDMLLDAGADLEARDGLGFTPLMVAASCRVAWKRDGAAAGTIRLLLARGARVQATDNNGRTALHHAAADAHRQAAILLLEAGASLAARNDRRRTPIEEALLHHVADPDDDRKTRVPRTREEDIYYDVVLLLFQAERASGLHPRRLQSIRAKARQHRCPEMVDALQ